MAIGGFRWQPGLQENEGGGPGPSDHKTAPGSPQSAVKILSVRRPDVARNAPSPLVTFGQSGATMQDFLTRSLGAPAAAPAAGPAAASRDGLAGLGPMVSALIQAFRPSAMMYRGDAPSRQTTLSGEFGPRPDISPTRPPAPDFTYYSDPGPKPPNPTDPLPEPEPQPLDLPDPIERRARMTRFVPGYKREMLGLDGDDIEPLF